MNYFQNIKRFELDVSPYVKIFQFIKKMYGKFQI